MFKEKYKAKNGKAELNIVNNLLMVELSIIINNNDPINDGTEMSNWEYTSFWRLVKKNLKKKFDEEVTSNNKFFSIFFPVNRMRGKKSYINISVIITNYNQYNWKSQFNIEDYIDLAHQEIINTKYYT